MELITNKAVSSFSHSGRTSRYEHVSTCLRPREGGQGLGVRGYMDDLFNVTCLDNGLTLR